MLEQLVGEVDKKKPQNWLLLARGFLRMSGGQPDPRLTDTVEPELG